MDKHELLHELRRHRVLMTNEAPYCVVSRTLVDAIIRNLEGTLANTDPLMDSIRRQTTRR